MQAPRRPLALVVAALAALTVPMSNACAVVTTSPSHSVAYLTAPQGAAGHGRLVAARPHAPRWVFTATGTRTGWVELQAASTTTTTTAGTSRHVLAPDGHGYLWTADTLGGRTVAAGRWTPTVELKARGTLTVTPQVRVFRHDAHGYHLLVTSTGTATRLGATAVAVTLPAVTAPAVRFATGDHLYVDVSVDVTGAGIAAGDGVLHEDGVGTVAALTFPHRSKTPSTGGTATPTPSASSTPSGPAPTTSAHPAPTTTAHPAPTTTAHPAPTTTAHPAPTATHATVTTTPPLPVTSTTAPGSSGLAGIWHPKPGTTWQWQITGTVDPTLPVDMYDIDLYDAQTQASSYTVAGFGTVNVPEGANPGIIADLHSRGKVVVCYLDTGAYESYRPDASLFPQSVIGSNTGWAGENWLDLRLPSWSKFEPLIAARLDLAKRSGCDGVEADQNNPLGNNPGFAITAADQKAWYLEVAKLAHQRNLSVGQKNGIETTDADTIAAFDWDLNEECNKYSECSVLDGYIAAGKAVFQVEYQDEGMTTSFCPADNAAHFDGLLKKLELGTWRVAC